MATNIFPDATLEKSSKTEKEVNFDYANELPSSNSLRAVGSDSLTKVKAEDQDGVDVTDALIPSFRISGTTLIARIKGGNDGNTYLVTFTGETDSSFGTFEKYLIVRVIDPHVVV